MSHVHLALLFLKCKINKNSVKKRSTHENDHLEDGLDFCPGLVKNDKYWDIGDIRQRVYSMPTQSRYVPALQDTCQKRMRSFTISACGHVDRGPTVVSQSSNNTSDLPQQSKQAPLGEVEDSYKIGMVGKLGVGKSSIIRSFTANSSFSSSGKLSPFHFELLFCL